MVSCSNDFTRSEENGRFSLKHNSPFCNLSALLLRETIDKWSSLNCLGESISTGNFNKRHVNLTTPSVIVNKWKWHYIYVLSWPWNKVNSGEKSVLFKRRGSLLKLASLHFGQDGEFLVMGDPMHAVWQCTCIPQSFNSLVWSSRQVKWLYKRGIGCHCPIRRYKVVQPKHLGLW